MKTLSIMSLILNQSGGDRVVLLYGEVPKGLLTFLGSFYKEVAKTTSGTLVYRFKRQTARKKLLPSKKKLCPRLRM